MENFPENRVLEISTGEPLVLDALQRFTMRLLRLAPGVEAILETTEIFPDEGVLHLASASLYLYGQTPAAQQAAKKHLRQARQRLERFNTREAAWLTALELWHDRRFDEAARAFEAITTQWPNDLLALKALEFLYYILGQQESGPRFRAQMHRLAPHHRDDPDFLAVHAFAHELCGDGAQARALAERALELAPLNPWAQHALEHLLLWEGSPEEAMTRMEGWLDEWEQAGRVIHCHNAWHVALAHLDRLDSQRAFSIFQEHVAGKTPELVVEQLDTIAFLWRAEMAGEPVDPEAYRPLLPHLRPLAGTLFMPFVSAHYAYAFARTGEEEALEELLAAVDERTGRDDEEARRVWQPVGRSILHGVAALGRGEAADGWFDPVMDKMMRIGGSDAQDDLFRFAHWESLRRAGRQSDAKALLEGRLRQKPASPLEAKLLAHSN